MADWKQRDDQFLIGIFVAELAGLHTPSEIRVILETIKRGATVSGVSASVSDCLRLAQSVGIENGQRTIAANLPRMARVARPGTRENTANIVWMASNFADVDTVPYPSFAQRGSSTNRYLVESGSAMADPFDQISDWWQKALADATVAYPFKSDDEKRIPILTDEGSDRADFDAEYLSLLYEVAFNNPD